MIQRERYEAVREGGREEERLCNCDAVQKGGRERLRERERGHKLGYTYKEK